MLYITWVYLVTSNLFKFILIHDLVILLSISGIKKLVVFVNKVDIMDDEEMLELVEMEIQELLEKYGFDAEETPIVFGSARFFTFTQFCFKLRRI